MAASSNSSQVAYFSMEMTGLVSFEFAWCSASVPVQDCVGLLDWTRRPEGVMRIKELKRSSAGYSP